MLTVPYNKARLSVHVPLGTGDQKLKALLTLHKHVVSSNLAWLHEYLSRWNIWHDGSCASQRKQTCSTDQPHHIHSEVWFLLKRTILFWKTVLFGRTCLTIQRISRVSPSHHRPAPPLSNAVAITAYLYCPRVMVAIKGTRFTMAVDMLGNDAGFSPPPSHPALLTTQEKHDVRTRFCTFLKESNFCHCLTVCGRCHL